MRSRGSNSKTSVMLVFLSATLFLITALSTFAQTPVTPPGSGTQADPYLISELGHLVWMGDTVADSEGKYYTMTADIDASDTANWNDEGTDTTVLEGFKPIGDNTSFEGAFDGNDHTITGLTINRTGFVGMFETVGTGGQLQNLGLAGVAIIGHGRAVGGLVCTNDGTLSNCYIIGTITGDWYVGGLAGFNYSQVLNCYTTGAVSGDKFVGGLVGSNASGTVMNCYATGEVAGNDNVGGLVGLNNNSTVENCYTSSVVDGVSNTGGLIGYNNALVSTSNANGAVTGTYNYIGGLVGQNYQGTVLNCFATSEVNGAGQYVGGLLGYCYNSTVSDCYATGMVNGSDDYVGGLLGYSSQNTVSNCYATGVVEGTNIGTGGLVGYNYSGTMSYCYATGAVTGNSRVGGLFGYFGYSTVSYCFATGEVKGTGNWVGGLVGSCTYDGLLSNCYAMGAVTGNDRVAGLVGYLNGTSAIVSNCYAVGRVTGTGSYLGGLVGNKAAGTVMDAYWDVEATGQSTSAGGEGKTTAEMKQQATFVDWDFTDIWGIVENQTYPYLQDLPRRGIPVTPPGSGTEADPYLISELGHLVWMSDTVADSAGKYYLMTADIDASDTACWNDEGTDTSVLEGFKPIGTHWDPNTKTFRGNFDGNGHTIIGLVINRPSTYYEGLFGVIDSNSQLQNLGMIGCVVTAYNCVGSLVGLIVSGTVSDCYASGAVTGSSYVGGLVGSNDGTVLNCYATCKVTGTYKYVGGLIGDTNCGTVSNCYATGAVTGFGSVGGLIGIVGNRECYGTVEYCYATGAVTGEDGVGGLVGNIGGTISHCYATGEVTGDWIVGGLVGGVGWTERYGIVEYCYATGAVTGGDYVGGLAGENYYGLVSNCYAIGAVTGYWYNGGLIGTTHSYYGAVSDSYWDVETTGQSTSDGGEGKTTAEMMQQVTFVDWDFVDIWNIVENETYPYLQNMLDDLDGDGVIDQLDACLNTIPGVTVDAQGCPPEVPGDFDRDGDVDAYDLDTFTACFSGPTIAYTGDCDTADFDLDNDVDQMDFGVFQRCYSDENTPAVPDCAN